MNSVDEMTSAKDRLIHQDVQSQCLLFFLKEGCVMEIILPLFICFLRSITKFGAVAGLGLLSSVIYASGSDAI